MMIRKRIVISNFIMLLVPAILIVVIAIGVLEGFTEIYGKKITVFDEDNGISNIEKIVYSYSRDIRNNNKKIEDYMKTEQELSNVGYNLLITSDENIIFSNITEEDKTALSRLESYVIKSSGSMVIRVNYIGLVKSNIVKANKNINIIAVKSTNEIISRQRMQLEARTFLATYIGIVFLISLFIIMLTNGMISSRIAKSLLKPLDILSNGATKIENGDLDFNISYQGRDEFRKVCDDFNRMKDRLKESIELQLKYEQNRRELVAGISHDLRTPLTTIKGYSQGLKDRIANTEKMRERYYEIIYSKASDMEQLVEKLFFFSKLDTGKYPFKFEDVDSNDFFNNFFNNYAAEFNAKGINLNYKNNCGINICINIDYEEISRVLLNIIENSAKYKEKEIGNVQITIDEKDGNIVLKIKDDGPGVLEENLPLLFNSFYREDSARTNASKGSGLGLSICEYIVKAHNGTIEAVNMDGLVIIVTFPIAK